MRVNHQRRRPSGCEPQNVVAVANTTNRHWRVPGRIIARDAGPRDRRVHRRVHRPAAIARADARLLVADWRAWSWCFGHRLPRAPEFLERATCLAKPSLAGGGQLENSLPTTSLTWPRFVFPGSRESALFEAAQRNEHGSRRYGPSGCLLEFGDHRRPVGPTTQPVQCEHDVMLEFTQCHSTHRSPCHQSNSVSMFAPATEGKKQMDWTGLQICNDAVTY